MVSDHKAYYKNNLYLFIFIICDKNMAPIQAVFTVKKRRKNPKNKTKPKTLRVN